MSARQRSSSNGRQTHQRATAPDRSTPLWRAWRGRAVPELARFFGIVVRMNFRDHPPPHFHARYGDQDAAVGILTLGILRGELSPRVLGLVLKWAASHRKELSANWDRAQSEVPLHPIAPLT